MHAIIVNDHLLSVVSASDRYHSSGYANIENKDVFFDGKSQNVSASIRLKPSRINSRYWQSCDEAALADNEAGLRTNADLIWKQLEFLKNEVGLQDIVFIAPSHYSATQLQLMLGIAKAANLNVLGVVNKAVAASMPIASTLTRADMHIDLQVHQSVVSRLQVSSGQLSLQSHDINTDFSIHVLQEALLKALQTLFIKNDRFDPLHHASTEQQLFDQLYELSANIAKQGFGNVNVDFNGATYSVKFDKSDWHQTLMPVIRTINVSGAHRVALELNGSFFADAIKPLLTESHNVKVAVAESRDCFATVREIASTFSSGQIFYLTELSLGDQLTGAKNNDKIHSDDTDSADESTGAAQTSYATHLLCEGVAIAIDSAHINFDSAQLSVTYGDSNLLELLSSNKISFVGQGATTTTDLSVGTRLVSELADGVLTAIRVES